MSIHQENFSKTNPLKGALDIFKEKCVIHHLFSNFSNFRNANRTKNEGKDELFIDPTKICRLCAKKDSKHRCLRLFDRGNKLLPVSHKIVSLIGPDKIKQDLLPQQVCVPCAENVSNCLQSIKLFKETFEILSKCVESFASEFWSQSMTGIQKSLLCTQNALLKIDENYYDLKPSDYLNTSRRETMKIGILDNSRLKSAPSHFKCMLCLKNFLSSETLKLHMQTSHSCQVEYSCLFCDLKLDALSDLSKHIIQSKYCYECYKEKIGENQNEKQNNTNIEINNEFNRGVGNIQILEKDRKEFVEIGTSDFEANDDLNLSADCDISNSESENIAENEKSNNKINEVIPRLIIRKQVERLVNEGTQLFKTCIHCNQIFKSNKTDQVIKDHVLVHICSDQAKVEQLSKFDISKHISYTPCFECKHCQMPKRDALEIKRHLRYCIPFRKEYNLNLKVRKKQKTVESCVKKCCACSEVFTDKVVYMSHLELTHPESIAICHVCEKVFVNKSSLRNHIKTHTTKDKRKESDSIMCEFCSKVCKSEKGYKFHLTYGHLNTTNRVKTKTKTSNYYAQKNYALATCDICGRNIPTRSGDFRLEFHKLKHSYPAGKVECCNRYISTYLGYTRHMRSHNKQWHCRLCLEDNVTFVSYAALLDHLKADHDKNDLSCPICQKVFQNRAKQLSHMNIHTKGNQCAKCNLEFPNKQSYSDHRKMYHGKSPLPYNIANGDELRDIGKDNAVYCCGSKFTKLGNLKVHISKHQKKSCKKCGAVLNSKLELISHNFARHRRSDSDCPVCHKKLANSESLKLHMLKHNQTKQFHCYCGLSFYTHNALKRHRRRRKTPCIGELLEATDSSQFLNEENCTDPEAEQNVLWQIESVSDLPENMTIVLGNAVLQKISPSADE